MKYPKYFEFDMHIANLIYNKIYPLTLLNKMRACKRNKKKRFTILCGNCMGGYMYHQLGVKFQSPTINLVIPQPHLLKLANNLDFYKQQIFTPIDGGGRLGDIDVVFTHYSSFEEGVSAWNKRFERVVRDDIYIMATDRDGMTEEMIRSYDSVPCKKLVIFTAKPYDLPYCFYVKEFEGCSEVGNLLKKTLGGKWFFETVFDWVGWLNSGDVVAEHFRIR